MSKEQIEEMAADICLVKHNCNDVCNPINTCNALKYARRAYEAGYRKQEWISVEERLPERSCECLVATNIGGIYQVSYSHRYKAFNALDTDEAKYAMLAVTHWMPLPNPPKGE